MSEVKISTADIQKLREMTGAGMMDCKKALTEAGGDYQGAIDELRKKGIAKAAKREDREAKEGVVIAQVNSDQTKGIVIALQCETDFVARNEGYIAMAQKMADIALANLPATLADLLALPYEPGVSILEKVGEQNGIIGEKVELGRYDMIEGAQIVTYNHSNRKRSVLLAMNKVGYEEAGRNLAMQIAAMNPVSVSKDDVSQRTRNRQGNGTQRRQSRRHARQNRAGPPEQVFPGKHAACAEVRQKQRSNGRTVPAKPGKRPDGYRFQTRRDLVAAGFNPPNEYHEPSRKNSGWLVSFLSALPTSPHHRHTPFVGHCFLIHE
jgi:elongation factor Ts